MEIKRLASLSEATELNSTDLFPVFDGSDPTVDLKKSRLSTLEAFVNESLAPELAGKADLVNGQIPSTQARASTIDSSVSDALFTFTDARDVTTSVPKITNEKIANDAGIAWSKISKAGALPADVGAAAASHNQAWTTITSVPAALTQISTLEPANRYTIIGNGTQFQSRQLTISDIPELPGVLDQKVPVAGFATAVRGAIANGAGLLYNQASGVFSLDVSFINQLIENYVNPPITTYALSIESGFALSIEGGRKLLID